MVCINIIRVLKGVGNEVSLSQEQNIKIISFIHYRLSYGGIKDENVYWDEFLQEAVPILQTPLLDVK